MEEPALVKLGYWFCGNERKRKVEVDERDEVGAFLDLSIGARVKESRRCLSSKKKSRYGVGGTWKETGDRHPKIGEGALLGACVTVLGNISIGAGAMVTAGSLVLKDVPPHSVVAGNPAKLIRVMDEQDPSLAMKYEVLKFMFVSIVFDFKFKFVSIVFDFKFNSVSIIYRFEVAAATEDGSGELERDVAAGLFLHHLIGKLLILFSVMAKTCNA
ncbi:hypothetical protein DY000_02018930 [Brassica cretica]|uniref:Serine O-acetyltransferase n=1 Tax=Brassica cretica TaxID=69181 RepID=A0ABQ7CYZ9_BRACR|nr:hypothetical protein DY000_02018930 [Brassica cretica]